jgi:hypothetical protein
MAARSGARLASHHRSYPLLIVRTQNDRMDNLLIVGTFNKVIAC